MKYEVIVVGGGIGGLTVAAVLAARGVSVCLFERQSEVGGCAATVEHGGFRFDPTFGLYTGWEPGGTYDRLFAEVGVTPPRASLLSSAYVVRLAAGIDVPRTTNAEEFGNCLRSAFPECSDAAISFYRDLTNSKTSENRQTRAGEHLRTCSERFRSFVNVQLQVLAQCSSDECNYELAANALDPRRSFWQIEGGVQTLIDSLVESFKQNGGKLRLNSSVLRLAYESDGLPIGVDLLNGERVLATRAIVSNLTIWDTYGKLVGPGCTPRNISLAVKELRASGIYQMFLTISPTVAATLPRSPLLTLTDSADREQGESHQRQLTFCSPSLATGDVINAPHTAVVSAYTRAEDWFSFHEDHSDFEARDQAMLEEVWAGLHSRLPELGEGVELIETATPQTLYENVRRRFGMIGRPTSPSPNQLGSATPYSNLWIVGDTVAHGLGIEGVVQAGLLIARQVTG